MRSSVIILTSQYLGPGNTIEIKDEPSPYMLMAGTEEAGISIYTIDQTFYPTIDQTFYPTIDNTKL
jgi:hypothetical protein